MLIDNAMLMVSILALEHFSHPVVVDKHSKEEQKVSDKIDELQFSFASKEFQERYEE